MARMWYCWQTQRVFQQVDVFKYNIYGFYITYTMTTVVGNTVCECEFDILYAGGSETKQGNEWSRKCSFISDKRRDYSLLQSAGQCVKLATNTGIVLKLMRGDVTPFPHTSSLSDVCFLTGTIVIVSTVENI